MLELFPIKRWSTRYRNTMYGGRLTDIRFAELPLGMQLRVALSQSAFQAVSHMASEHDASYTLVINQCIDVAHEVHSMLSLGYQMRSYDTAHGFEAAVIIIHGREQDGTSNGNPRHINVSLRIDTDSVHALRYMSTVEGWSIAETVRQNIDMTYFVYTSLCRGHELRFYDPDQNFELVFTVRNKAIQ